MSKSKVVVGVLAVALLAGGGVYWFQVGAMPFKGEAKTDVAANAAPLVLAAPPRETREDGQAYYGPIAKYLSDVIGRPVVYKHPGTWGVYRTEMLQGAYDIVFDGGHFGGYRVLKLDHHAVAKIPRAQQFSIIVRKDENINDVSELVGKTFCSPPPPNQGALHALSKFPNPAQQPVVVPITKKFWPSVYEGVVGKRCTGGVLVSAIHQKLDKDGATKVILQTPEQANQAFTVGPRITSEERAKIAAALTAPEAAEATAKLRERFKVGESFVAANDAEYVGLAELLRNEWGFFK